MTQCECRHRYGREYRAVNLCNCDTKIRYGARLSGSPTRDFIKSSFSLHPPAGLWDSVAEIHSAISVSMRLAIDGRAVLMKASAAVALLLLCASAAPASPAFARHHRHIRRSCSQKPGYTRKVPRRPRAPLGPVARPSTHALAGLTDLTALLKRGLRANLPDDDEAIQNDAPAARLDSDGRPVPALLPLGVLHGCLIRRLCTHSFSPRSPRGPPTSA